MAIFQRCLAALGSPRREISPEILIYLTPIPIVVVLLGSLVLINSSQRSRRQPFYVLDYVCLLVHNIISQIPSSSVLNIANLLIHEPGQLAVQLNSVE